MKLGLIVLGMLVLTLSCSREEPLQTSSRLPLTSLLEMMLLPREELKEIPNLDAFEEFHGLGTYPEFEIGEFDVMPNRMREEGWSVGLHQGYSNPEAQGGGSILAFSFSIDAYADHGGAKRILDAMHNTLLKHLDYTPSC